MSKNKLKSEKKLVRIGKRLFSFLLIIVVLCVFGTFIINIYMIQKEKDHILTVEKAADLENVDCVIVLGCSVKADGSPSLMLKDRLNKSVELYNAKNQVILMSGDHKTNYYNEPNTMKNYVVERGVDSADVFVDHAGYSTYDSLYRAKEIYGAKKVIIITQEYHLYRSMYIADQLGLEVYGVPTDDVRYSGQLKRDIREIFARNKDFLSCIFWPEASFMGGRMTLDGDGNQSNERQEE